jgi:eukaryotic-like serine/threonine-protein kinase
MNEPPSNVSAGRRCPKCGAELPGDLPLELCPKCLLKAGLPTQPGFGPKGTIVVSAEALAPGLPQPGDLLGHYRIVRSLGGGGMGNVFEAEDLENGRRVALKMLSQTLDSPEARHRFFREGRLAASINHPNSVYVFGTEELGGVPLITMELVAGGTLEDRVRSRGPMTTTEAVDAVLQIIAGLEVAQRIGIIHRDVKPSNCFVDSDGTVKIGDFGLSISTAVRKETAVTVAGSFLGTPAFCSPEQLRGEELNAKSDMYSVGATLFYLLTGRTPFQAKNVIALIATVLEQPVPSPRQFQPKLPRGLSKAVRRCLEKQPGERFGSYEELRKALAPFSSTAPVPASLRLRFVAGLLDVLILYVPGWIIVNMFTRYDYDDITDYPSRQTLAIFLIIYLSSLLYYALLEGRWGMTLGKLVCGLKVVAQDNNPPGFFRALLRCLFYIVVPELPYWLFYAADPKGFKDATTTFQFFMDSSMYFLTALLFCTARRRNGLAAVHDLITETRVISRPVLQARLVPAVVEVAPTAVETKPLVGPYHVLDTLEDSAGVSWALGYDIRLLRKIWIRVVPAGTPPVPIQLRNIGRVGRLRWLAGRRSAAENWDAFEAPSGQPLVRLLQERPQKRRGAKSVGQSGRDAGPDSNPQPWAQVRLWLCDLANEFSVAQKDGTMPPVLALDRIWIAGDGRAKILDFPAPNIPASPGEVTSPNKTNHIAVARFLEQVAAAALEGWAESAVKPACEVSVPLPLHVRQFFKDLSQYLDADALLFALRGLVQRVTVVTRTRRAAVVAGCILFPFLLGGGAMLFPSSVEDSDSLGFFQLVHLLSERSRLRHSPASQSSPTDSQYAVYIASHYRDVVSNDVWSSRMSRDMTSADERRFAQESLAQHPAPTDKEIADADAAIKKVPVGPDLAARLWRPSLGLTVLNALLALVVCPLALVAALVFRGGLALLATDVTYVRSDGLPASRTRLLWRTFVAWIPVLLAFVLSIALMAVIAEGDRIPHHAALAFGLLASLVVLCVGLPLLSIALPQRGLQDRLAGTWPVPQ